MIPDRIEAGTFLVAGAIAGKGVTVKRVEPEHATRSHRCAGEMRFHIDIGDHAISILPNGDASALELTTAPYPGFPTDMQAQMCALLSTSRGHQFCDRKCFSAALYACGGAKAHGCASAVGGATAVIDGVDCLLGAPVMASDLRASAALVLAGLKADGITEVSRVYHIDRGYEHLDEKLSELGAHIERAKAA
mgnify:CR=1 FL=1